MAEDSRKEVLESVMAIGTDDKVMSTRAQDAISERNQRESPLLRLPAELRMKIWEFAVGGHVVECFVVSSSPEGLHRLSEAYDVQDLYCKDKPNLDIWRSCRRKKFQDIFVNGLVAPICRQIRAEAAGLQFKTNIFFFDGKKLFDLFVEVLSKAQLGSIQEMSFLGDAWWFNPVSEPRSTAKLEVHSVLASLKRIYIHPHWPNNASQVSSDADLKAIRGILETGPCLSFENNTGIEVLAFDVLNRNASLKDVSQIFHL